MSPCFHRIALLFLVAFTLPTIAGCPRTKSTPATLPAGVASGPALKGYRLVHRETFDTPFSEPAGWTEDTYGEDSPWNVDAFDDDGAFFIERGGEAFLASLRSFRSFRKSFTYGDDGWITVELYGRDSDKDGVPETGGHFLSERGKAKLVSTRHYDGAILRSTRPLPSRYRVEVTVSNINFGGRRGGSWEHGGKLNGYDGSESSAPWRFSDQDITPIPAVIENGLYFLCITDYERPAPITTSSSTTTARS